MGLIRKAFVIGTLGTTPVGLTSKKEKLVRNTRVTAELLAEQNRLLRQQAEMTPGTTDYEAKLRREENLATRQAQIAANKQAREERSAQRKLDRNANPLSPIWGIVGRWLLFAVALLILIGLAGTISPALGVFVLVISAPVTAIWRFRPTPHTDAEEPAAPAANQ